MRSYYHDARKCFHSVFHVCLYYTVMSVPCSLVITCWEWADLLALVCVMFSCVFVTFHDGVSGQVWYLIVSIPDLCLLLYFQTYSSLASGVLCRLLITFANGLDPDRNVDLGLNLNRLALKDFFLKMVI